MAPRWSLRHINPLVSDLFVPCTGIEPISQMTLQEPSQRTTQLVINPVSVNGYPPNHLLGLPAEIRDEIWQRIFNDITTTQISKWFEKPVTEFDALLLTCSQIKDEVAYFWPRTIIQRNRIHTFVQPRNLTDFKRLTLEIAHELPHDFFQQAALALTKLAPALQDLRIFFVGNDGHGIPTFIHGCGFHEPSVESTSKKLTFDGQREQERQPIFVAIRQLRQLRSLVLSNCNYPILQSFIIAGKPRLKRLHIATDPRSTLHKNHDIGRRIMLKFPVLDHFPPVTHLNISTNAALTSVQVASKCASTLKHLTWIVPDVSRQAGSFVTDWYVETAVLLHNLRDHAKELRTLRICIEGPIYEADQAGVFMGGFHQHFEHIPIEAFELHLNSKSPWFGREVLKYLPKSVRRLYLSQELIDESMMTEDISRRYLIPESPQYQDPPSSCQCPVKTNIYLDKLDCSREHFHRTDYISMSGGKLGFVGFAYSPGTNPFPGDSEPSSGDPEEAKMKLLKMNGRLLDRERNTHLTKYNGGRFIPPTSRSMENVSTEAAEEASLLKINSQVAGDKLTADTGSGVGKHMTWKTQWDITTKLEPNAYFGMEDQAQKVFEMEAVAEWDDLPALTWPEEVAVGKQDHWMTQ